MRIAAAKSTSDPEVAEVFAKQEAQWGGKLKPYEIYARRPSIFKSVVGMWNGLGQSGLLEVGLTSLINRRVAALNGCVF